MQVNWRYHQEKLGTTWQALDPYHNLRVGAAILRACYEIRQDWWSSVGCYHAPANANRADRYRQRVVSHWRRIKKCRVGVRMNAVKWLKVIGIVIGLIPALAGAALTVIYDSGDTQPIAPFLDVFESSETTAPQRPATPAPAAGCRGSRLLVADSFRRV